METKNRFLLITIGMLTCMVALSCQHKPEGEALRAHFDSIESQVVEDSIKPSAAEEAKAKEQAQVKQFLSDIYADGAEEIFQDAWVHKHCTARMQQKLRDEYDYDGEGWGSWLIGGWGAGEDLQTKVQSITADYDYYYVTKVPTAESSAWAGGKRVLRFKIEVKDGVPVIDDCEWTEDLKYYPNGQ